jgi:hypothetical protein
MRFAILCERSGIVRDAFIAAGHIAVSFDIEQSDRTGPHIQGDIRDFEEYILLFDVIIAFPPCTYLSSVGNRAMKEKPARRLQRKKAYDFCMWIWGLNVKRKCIENPVGYLNGRFPSPDPENPDKSIVKKPQIIHPWYFGDREMKKTCLFLDELPPLIHSEGDMFYERTHTDKPEPYYQHKQGKKKGQNVYFVEAQTPSKDRQKIRAETFPGVANAMTQWGNL